MSQEDIQTLAQIAQGEGELRVSKRLMRDLLALASAGRAAAPSGRMGGSIR